MTHATEPLTLPGMPSLPGLTVRHYQGPTDLPGVVEVLHESRRADGVDWLPSLEDLRNEFEHLVNEVPERDMLIVEQDGRIVAWARSGWSLRDDGHVYRTSGEVHPNLRRRGIGRALLHASQRHLRDLAAGHPADSNRRLVTETLEGEAAAAALLASEGYVAVRFFFEMLRPLSEPIPTFDLPAGIEVRPVVAADHKRIFAAESEAFRDHWGHREWTDVDFERTFTSPDLEPALWRVAWAGGEVVSVVETFIHAEENRSLGTEHGWLERISTRRPWRGRGIAHALIASAMQALVDRGMTHAALGVDADNPSGAFQLYESLGFRVAHRMEALSRPLAED